MELRELRRQLLYRLAIGDTLDYGVYVIVREDTSLVATSGSRRHVVRIKRHYDRAVDELIARMTEPTAVKSDEWEPVVPELDWHTPPRIRSKFRGVNINYNSRNKPYEARVIHGGHAKRLGAFSDDVSAACAYDDYVRANGLNRRLNFPDRMEAAS